MGAHQLTGSTALAAEVNQLRAELSRLQQENSRLQEQANNGFYGREYGRVVAEKNALVAENSQLREGLADIAFSDDVTLDVAKRKAKRLYELGAEREQKETR